jgi:hypothetical protein
MNMFWLVRFGAVCGIVLGLSLGLPAVVEALTGETAVTSFVIGLVGRLRHSCADGHLP